MFYSLGLKKPKLPSIVASEAAECGLACLAMIGCYHGHDIDLSFLRSRFSLSFSGLTLRSLIKIADQLDLGARAMRVDLEALGKVSTPAILHWDLSHYVVLKHASARRIVIHDPVHGQRTLSFDQVSNHFTGIVLELVPRQRFDVLKGRAKINVSSLWSRASGLGIAAAQTLVLSVLLQAAAFSAPFYLQLLTDTALKQGSPSLLMSLAVGFGAVAALQVGLSALRDWTVQVVGNMLAFQLMGNLVSHLLRLPATFFEKRHIGDILSRVGSTSDVQDALTRGIVSALIDGIMASVAVGIMAFYSVLLTTIVVAAVTANTLLSTLTYSFVRDLNEEYLISSARERSHIMESMRAYSTIKLLGAEAEREGAWRNLFSRVTNTSLKLARTRTTLEAVQSLITSVSGIAVIYLAATFVMVDHSFTMGMLFAFISFRQTFTDRATSLLQQATQFRLLGLHLDRVGDIIAVPTEASAVVIPDLSVKGSISVQGVSFRYGDTDPFILTDLSLDIAEGEFVAIVGPSGGGKTTLLKLIVGLLKPTGGRIILDDIAASDGLFRQWRASVGVVAQDDQLLSGSIAENIAIFDPEIDMKRVEQAATLAQVHHDIQRLPSAYLSLVGDMGSSLSEGQKQRVLLARALYRQPKILILDEGTANLDVGTEDLIADVITDLSITRVVVAHRPALIERADRIITIGDDRVVDLGSNKLSVLSAVQAA